MEEKLEEIVEPLLEWYQENKRILPWRENKNPYCIWISEIMLQQTRIEAVKRYYARFMKELPNIQSLANIPEERLLKLWEGLGYYNRARNLQKAAKIIEQNYKGEMPNTYAELITLAGIGEYTAGAIASIAYNERIPAVDGNVLRVISRVTASDKDVILPETKKVVTEQLKTLMTKQEDNFQAGDFNEALMELGELICLPNGEPICQECPLQRICIAYQKGLTQELPIRVKKLKRKEEDRTVFLLVSQEGKIAIKKRNEKGVLSGMYELPNSKGKVKNLKELEEILKKWNLKGTNIENIGEYQHIFTHITWKMIAYNVAVEKENEEFTWVTKKQLEKAYALPTAFKKVILK
ncbi:MAG: A/G-specific adenine glycosylase [Clostridia bacterium]|nr:A/G-specific adenine glycosylase [Clostridia bacterium]MCI9413204.1 A/G-specific adenine glycosylase [Clostridia bacterium]